MNLARNYKVGPIYGVMWKSKRLLYDLQQGLRNNIVGKLFGFTVIKLLETISRGTPKSLECPP